MPTRFVMHAFGFAEKDVFFSARLWRYRCSEPVL
jgi:hypothetical protein